MLTPSQRRFLNEMPNACPDCGGVTRCTCVETAPEPGSRFVGVGPLGEEKWVVVRAIENGRVVYEVLDGSEEGRTMSYRIERFVRLFVVDVP